MVVSHVTREFGLFRFVIGQFINRQSTVDIREAIVGTSLLLFLFDCIILPNDIGGCLKEQHSTQLIWLDFTIPLIPLTL